MKRIKLMTLVLLAAFSGYSAALLTVDFESDTEGSQPAANDLSPSPNTADNFNTVINSTANKAGTGQGLEFYDNSAAIGTRLGYNFSSGESAVRCDVSFATLNTGGANGDYVAVCVLANGASAATSANRYCEVRFYDNGTIRFYEAGLYLSGSETPISLNTAYTLSMYVNDGDSSVSYNSGANTLAANSADFWLDGSFLFSAALNTISAGTTAGLGSVGFASSSTDLGIDYAFDNIEISTLVDTEPPTPPSSSYFLSVDFESDTVGQDPVANYVSQSPPGALVTVVDSSVNTAGTGNGVRLYDNTTATGSRVGYDFSTGESAVRFDISMAQLLDTGASSRYYSICILANGASPTSSSARYTEVRVYDNGDIRYYSNGVYVSGAKSNYMTVGTPATLTMYANDSNDAMSYNSGANTLAANSVDFWLDGTYWGTGALLASLSGSTTAGLGRVAVGSGSSDVLMDYVFDDLLVSAIEQPPEPGVISLYLLGE